MSKPSLPTQSAVAVSLAEIQIHLLVTPKARARAHRLLAKHHDLGEVRAVGEPRFYAVTDGHGDWLGVLVFCAASHRLLAHDRWIGWSEASGLNQRLEISHHDDQCRVRLPKSMRVIGMFRRFGNSLLIHWG